VAALYGSRSLMCLYRSLYSSPTPEEMKAEGLHLWRAVGAQKSVMLFAAGDSGKPVGGPDWGSG